MKLMLGGTPVKKMMIHNDTMDATMVASDMQAGVTAYANGRKITGTGKSFEFANYGTVKTNDSIYVPSCINVIEIASFDYPVKLTLKLGDMKNVDFSTNQQLAKIVIDNAELTISASVNSNFLTISCNETINLQVFYGKDNYI